MRIGQVAELCVGTIGESAFEEIFREWFDGTELRLYPSPEEAFNTLDVREIDLFMASGSILLYATNYLERPNFKVNYIFDRAGDQTELRSIVGKAQKLVGTETTSNAWWHRVFDYRRRALERMRPYLLSAIAALLFLLVLILGLFARNRRIRGDLERMVENRTRELYIQARAAQVVLNAKSEFLALMSHEMYQPINAIIGMSKWMRESGRIEEKKTFARRIDGASKHLHGVIKDILEMSQIESAEQYGVREHFDLFAMLDNIRSIADYIAAGEKQRYVVNVALGVPRNVVGDESRISQVVANFLSNAFKFSPGGAKSPLTSTANAVRGNATEEASCALP